MTRYTVTAVPGVEDDLARIWLGTTNRASVSQASDVIDRMLRDDAPQKGEEAEHGLRQLIVPPLIAKFTVNEDERRDNLVDPACWNADERSLIN